VQDEELIRFIRNAFSLQTMRMRTLEEELSEPDWFDDVSMQLMDDESTSARWFIAIKAFE